jgi:hypothetical protein
MMKVVVTNPNRTLTHDGFRVDLGSSATTTNATASGVLFHNSTTHQLHFLVVNGDINRTMNHDGFRVEVGASATVANATASGVLLTTVLHIKFISLLLPIPTVL